MTYNSNSDNRIKPFGPLNEYGQPICPDSLPMYGNQNAAMPVQAPYYPQGPVPAYGAGQNIMGPYVPQIWNDPEFRGIIVAQEKAKIDLMKESEKAAIRIGEKRAMEEIHTEAEEKRVKQRADISSTKELQRTIVSIRQDGKVVISHEMFGPDMKKEVEIYCQGAGILKCMGDTEESILYAKWKLENNKEEKMFLDIKKLDDHYINKKFNQAKIRFGFSHAKETQIRSEVINEVMYLSLEAYIPRKHGWYEDNGRIGFAFPGSLVWEEVERNAQ